MRQLIHLDSDEMLAADVVGTWNGYAVPALTADALTDYYRRLDITDVRVLEDGDIMSLAYVGEESEATYWQAVATDDNGRNVYHVDGLIWVALDDESVLEDVPHHLDGILATDDHATREDVTRRAAAGDVAGLIDLYAWHTAN